MATNKIRGGYPAPVAATGVAPVRRAELADFGARIGQVEGLEAGEAGMTENCRFFARGWGVVAWSSSHGGRKAVRSQALGPRCRLIAGLTAGPSRSRLRASAAGAASPFRPAPGPTTVASERRGSTRIQASIGPVQCLKLRLGRIQPYRINGSGPEAGRLTPKNGVGGGACALDARIGSAGRENGAEGRNFNGLEHSARTPFVERRDGNCRFVAPPVNASVQSSVDKSR